MTISAETLSTVLQVYRGSNGEQTKALYARLELVGPAGVVAVNLFRACKASERAKVYRGGDRGRGSYRSMAYDRKDWSIANLCAVLASEASKIEIVWGWGIDAALKDRGDPHHHVLYVDIPHAGQCSFHTATRRDGPVYPCEWDGVRGSSADRICRWVTHLLTAAQAALTPEGPAIDNTPQSRIAARTTLGEICAECGKEIGMLEGSYYRKDPTCDIGKTFHAHCGDPFGIKAKDAEIVRLRTLLGEAQVMAGQSQAVPAGSYRWVRAPDGREQLQERWVGGPNLEEWRIAPPDAPQPPRIFTSDADWIEP